MKISDMRIAKTLEDLPIGTPIQIDGSIRIYKGLVIGSGLFHGHYKQAWIKIRFVDGSDVIYYEDEISEEEIMIVEVINESR